jgi:hypothetical protein
MKKQFLFLAGCAVLFASCGSNNNQGESKAQIDSSINATVSAHDAANAAKNDSTLKAIEKEKAEAVRREHEHGGKKEEANNNNAAAPAPAATVAPTKTAQDAKFDSRQPGNQATQGSKLTPDQQQAQDDKFNRRGK